MVVKYSIGFATVPTPGGFYHRSGQRARYSTRLRLLIMKCRTLPMYSERTAVALLRKGLSIYNRTAFHLARGREGNFLIMGRSESRGQRIDLKMRVDVGRKGRSFLAIKMQGTNHRGEEGEDPIP